MKAPLNFIKDKITFLGKYIIFFVQKGFLYEKA